MRAVDPCQAERNGRRRPERSLKRNIREYLALPAFRPHGQAPIDMIEQFADRRENLQIAHDHLFLVSLNFGKVIHGSRFHILAAERILPGDNVRQSAGELKG